MAYRLSLDILAHAMGRARANAPPQVLGALRPCPQARPQALLRFPTAPTAPAHGAGHGHAPAARPMHEHRQSIAIKIIDMNNNHGIIDVKGHK